MRATDDSRFDQLVHDAILSPSAVAAERDYLKARPRFEMPYGRAWFLRLAIDYEKRFADGRLSPMADDVAWSLVSYFKYAKPDPASSSYQSASWALIDLLDYGRFTHNRDIVSFVEDTIQRHFIEPFRQAPRRYHHARAWWQVPTVRLPDRGPVRTGDP